MTDDEKPTLGRIEHNSRGCEIIHFDDQHDRSCRVRAKGPKGVYLGLDGYEMRLSRSQVEALIHHLQVWLRDGTVEIERQP